MLIKTKAFVLSVIKFKDADAIVKTYTYEAGFVTYFIRGLYKSKKNKLKKAYFQPSAILNIVASNRENDNMEYIREASPAYHYENIHLDFDKLNVSIFLREILLYLLSNTHADKALFEFITKSFTKLDIDDFNPDFHIHFLMQLTEYLGFAPNTQTQGEYFDLVNGIFTSNTLTSQHFLDQKQTQIFKTILGTIFATNSNAKLTNTERQQALDIMMKYYEIQIENFRRPKSLQVLSGIYN